MDREELARKAREIIEREAKISTENVKWDTELTSLGMDSLDMLKVALALEKSFKITITTPELDQIRTFGDVVKGLEAKFPSQNPASSKDTDILAQE